MIKIFAAAAMLAAQGAPAAQAPKCLSKQSVGDAVMVLSPILIDSFSRHCRSHLPATAFLNSGAAAFAQRLRTESADRIASAADALRFFAGESLPPVQDKQALVQVAGEMAGAMIVQKFDAKSCVEISNLVESASPMPTRNVGLFATSMAGLVAAQSKGKGPGICPE